MEKTTILLAIGSFILIFGLVFGLQRSKSKTNYFSSDDIEKMDTLEIFDWLHDKKGIMSQQSGCRMMMVLLKRLYDKEKF